LPQGFAVLPMTSALYVEVNASSPELSRPLLPDVPEFEKLSVGVSRWLSTLSQHGPIAYVEAGYFGNEGSQWGAIWKDGALLSAPISGAAINHVLRFLGVVASAGRDEFDELTLGRHRRTDQWLAPDQQPA